MNVSTAGSAAFYLLLLAATTCAEAPRPDRPNILWLTSEDHGPHMGCYGDRYATTPNVDTLASRGMIYTRAWSNAPVCAPARTALISGMYPTSTGGEHMRSLVPYPSGLAMFPQLLRRQRHPVPLRHAGLLVKPSWVPQGSPSPPDNTRLANH